MKWYLEVLKKYAVFNGRSRRTEYWMFILFNFIITLVLSFVDNALGLGGGDELTGYGVLSGLYSLAVLLPGIGVTIRRLHDTDRSGWWILIGLIPCVGALVLIFFMVQDSTPGSNQYGANPKGA